MGFTDYQIKRIIPSLFQSPILLIIIYQNILNKLFYFWLLIREPGDVSPSRCNGCVDIAFSAVWSTSAIVKLRRSNSLYPSLVYTIY